MTAKDGARRRETVQQNKLKPSRLQSQVRLPATKYNLDAHLLPASVG